MWQLTCFFEDGSYEVRTYKTRQGVRQAAAYWFKKRPDMKEYEWHRVD